MSGSWRASIRTLLILLALSPALARATAELPNPDLSHLEASVQTRLAHARQALLAALDDPKLSEVERGRVYGRTGEIFQAAQVAPIARACYRNAIELDPGNAKWHHLAGWLAEQQSDLQTAEAEYARAQELDPSNPWHAFRLAHIKLQLNQMEAARSLLQKLESAAGMQAAVEAGLGRIASADGRFTEAVQHYEKALELQPDASQLRYPLAVALRRAGRLDEAREAAAQAGSVRVHDDDPIVGEMQAQSTSSNTYTRLAIRAIRSGHLEAAANALNSALELDETNNRARLNLGVVQMQMGHLERAESLMREALRRDPDYAYAHFNLAQLLEKKGDLAGAKSHYAAAVRADPKEAEFNFRYAALLTRIGDYAHAVERYDAVIDAAPAFTQARYLQALALVALGRDAEARHALEQATAIAPERKDLRGALARLIATRLDASPDDRQRALRIAAALYNDEKSTDSGETLAMALAAVGRFDEAIRLQQAVLDAARAAAPQAVLDHLQHNLDRYRNGETADQPWTRPTG
jgi:tetratricopeptide (TPR) repeat protein